MAPPGKKTDKGWRIKRQRHTSVTSKGALFVKIFAWNGKCVISTCLRKERSVADRSRSTQLDQKEAGQQKKQEQKY